MKIYQIHCYGGEWEDAYDYIVGSYLSQEKAIAEKERLEKEEVELCNCNECPLYYCDKECQYDDCDYCVDHRIDKIIEYCNRYEPEEYNKSQCKNYDHSYDSNFYKIVERIVIE